MLESEEEEALIAPTLSRSGALPLPLPPSLCCCLSPLPLARDLESSTAFRSQTAPSSARSRPALPSCASAIDLAPRL